MTARYLLSDEMLATFRRLCPDGRLPEGFITSREMRDQLAGIDLRTIGFVSREVLDRGNEAVPALRAVVSPISKEAHQCIAAMLTEAHQGVIPRERLDELGANFLNNLSAPLRELRLPLPPERTPIDE